MAKVTALSMATVTKKSSHQMTPLAVSVCITPAAPSPLPIPYPVFASIAEGVTDPPMRTKFNGAEICTVGSCFKKCHGNEAGTLKEVVSLNTGGPCFLILGAPNVFIELGMAGITGSPGFMNKAITVGAGANASGAGGAGGGGGSGAGGSASQGDPSQAQNQSGGGGGGGGGGNAGASADSASSSANSQNNSDADARRTAPEPSEESARLAAEPYADDGNNGQRWEARKEVMNHYFDNHHTVADPDNWPPGQGSCPSRPSTPSDQFGERVGTDPSEPMHYSGPPNPSLTMGGQERQNPETGETERTPRTIRPFSS
jgi:hypothetical protein